MNTVISFAVPFLASVPAELLGASGLVAAVVAGLVTGIRAPRELSPQNRLSDSQNWRTVELILEGAVFLTMGLQVSSILAEVESDHGGVVPAILISVGALVLTIVVRAAYIAPLLAVLSRMSKRGIGMAGRLKGIQERMATADGTQQAFDDLNRRPQRPNPNGDADGDGGKGSRRPGRAATLRDLERFSVRIRRVLADIDYFRRDPLGWREGAAVVWAGMRGAVTVAAAQTLPAETPFRSTLVLIAFAVAALSLLAQGGTIAPLLRLIAPDVDQKAADEEFRRERTEVFELMRSSAESVPEFTPTGEVDVEQFRQAKEHQLAVLAAQRRALLDARDDGTFDADVLAHALAGLDASQIALEMRG